MGQDIKSNNFYEILDLYNKKFEPLHFQNIVDLFSKLVNQSKVDIEANKKLVQKINSSKKERSDLRKNISKNNTLLALTIIVGLISSLILIFNLVAKAINPGFIALVIILIVGTITISYILITKTKKLKEKVKEVSNLVNKNISIAEEQMKPLNDLFTYGMSAGLFTKTLPLFNIDKTFKSSRYDQLVSQFDFVDSFSSDSETSMVATISGDINGNPFLIGKNTTHSMGTQVYTGQRTVSWSVKDSQGNLTTKSATISASITKPHPFYSTMSRLYYGNDAAPNLTFSRMPGNINKMSDSQLESYIKRKAAVLSRKAERSVKKGEDLTLTTNIEFEVLFNATNRKNEQEFRLLFTPLAQIEMIKLLKNKDNIGCGDNFAFEKNKKMNIIFSPNLQTTDLTDNPARFISYDFEQIQKDFYAYNLSYFKSLFFAFAPILVIPIYQQHKSHEYIYKDVYPANFSTWQHEVSANSLPETATAHLASRTTNIIKTRLKNAAKYFDEIEVSSWGYETIPRVEIVSKMAPNGKMYNIDISWTEFKKVERTTKAKILDFEKMNKDLKHRSLAEIEVPRYPIIITPELYSDTDEEIATVEKVIKMLEEI